MRVVLAVAGIVLVVGAGTAAPATAAVAPGVFAFGERNCFQAWGLRINGLFRS